MPFLLNQVLHTSFKSTVYFYSLGSNKFLILQLVALFLAVFAFIPTAVLFKITYINRKYYQVKTNRLNIN